ncbi:DUF3040 domain-containing protein [Streptosporangium sp. NBC_01639]|uniref:DUF3040 domain-containing protein n=1 Tax=unclassified Streptosporangium TaxID=2632669 RepID=UPI002DD995A1|nr:DUF3040 domain-containing protein [Streptosporangium sp. NBC_01756]WSC90722.1 DUF3040 domain-containing protein [Streptosporangium sp. NBC_01756]WTD58874.1 DUF3040 domain-containing protein [Streptosporangium sp. NBC_01639]
MPLSDHEQRLLDQIEQALYAEDPKWANTVRISDPRSHYKRRLVKASIGFILGIVLLMVGVVIINIPLGVGGFVVMLAACLWGLSSWKRMNGFGEAAAAPPGRPGKTRRRGGARQSFMERMEERWRRRHDER